MKRFTRFIAALAALIVIISSFTACGSGGVIIDVGVTDSPSRETDAPSGSVKPFGPDDIAIAFGGMTFRTGVDVIDVIEALGDEYVYKESVSCIRPGMEKTYEFDGLVIRTLPDGDRDVVCLYRITGCDFTTPRGVGAGTPEDDAKNAYPSDWYFDGTYYVQSLSGDPSDIDSDRIQLLFENGFVIEINIYSPSAGL